MLKDIYSEGVEKIFSDFVREFCQNEDDFMKELCHNVLISIQTAEGLSKEERYQNCKKLIKIMENTIENLDETPN